MAVSATLVAALAGYALASPSQEKGIEALIEEWKSEDFGERNRATQEILARCNAWGEQDIGKLESAARGEDPEVAARAREVLRRILIRKKLGTLAGMLPEAEEILMGSSHTERCALLRKAGELWLRGDVEDAPLEALALCCIEAGWRWDVRGVMEMPTDDSDIAAILVGRRPIRPYAPLVIAHLTSDDPHVRFRAMCGISWLQDERLAVHVLPLLKDPDEEARRRAVYTLAELMSLEHEPEVRAAAKDPSPLVRQAAGEALCQLGKVEEGTKILLELLECRESQVARFAASALLEFGGARHVDRTLPLTEPDPSWPDPNTYAIIRWALLRELAPHLEEKHLPRILNQVEGEEDPFMKGHQRVQAALACGRIGASLSGEPRTKLVNQLMEMEEGSDGNLRVGIAVALAFMGEKSSAEARKILADIAATTGDYWDLWKLFHDAMIRRFEPEAFAKLNRPCRPRRALRTLDELKEFVSGEGLTLARTESLPLWGYVGIHQPANVRQILDDMVGVHALEVMAEGDRVWMAPFEEAMQYWQKKLSDD